MLALITQTKLPRPWLQLGASGRIHIPLKTISAESPTLPLPPPSSRAMTECKPPNVGHKVKSSRIPRLMRIETVRKASSSLHLNVTSDQAVHRQAPITMTTTTTTTTTTAMTTTTTRTVNSPAACIVSGPLVRSTRTSRCRIQLAHPEWSVTDANECACANPLRETGVKHKSRRLIEPVIEASQQLKYLGKQQQQQMLCLQCCDQKQVHVPCQLIIHYSTLMRQRLKERSIRANEPLRLDTISSQTLLRLVMWMQQHYHDDLCQLQKALPSLAHASSAQCTWDEQFLGFDLDAVLQLLLASNYLGINPLLEHVTFYFLELLDQRNTGELQMQNVRDLLANSSSCSSDVSNSTNSSDNSALSSSPAAEASLYPK